MDVVESAYILAQMMREDPSGIEKDLIRNGDELIAVYQDGNYGLAFQNLRQLKKEVLEMAIQDIAKGIQILRTSSVGILFQGRNLSTYVVPFGSSPGGTVVYSIGWKNIKAFLNWQKGQKGQEEDIQQNEIDAAIYRLIYDLSAIL